jgi:hypothetical protein
MEWLWQNPGFAIVALIILAVVMFTFAKTGNSLRGTWGRRYDDDSKKWRHGPGRR